MKLILLLLVIFKNLHSTPPDMVIFSYNRPIQLYALLESVERRISGLGNIDVLCRIDPAYAEGYDIVAARFPNVRYIKQSGAEFYFDFKPLLMNSLNSSNSDYILFAVDDIIVTWEMDLTEGVQKLEETGAYGLFYRLGKNINFCYMLRRFQLVPPMQDVGGGYYTWQFNNGKDDWNYPNSVDLTLYRREEIVKEIAPINFANPNEFEGHWKTSHGTFGLCRELSAMINLPLNKLKSNQKGTTFTTKYLNTQFMNGFKIDIDEVYHVVNNSPHVPHNPKFVKR